MGKPNRLHLFHGYGVEWEYMIVDRDTLAVKPITDEVLQALAGAGADEFVNGPITWSNELVMHVLELKCSVPTPDLVALQEQVEGNLRLLNGLLAEHNACLMPTAAHPWMDPATDTRLWPYGNREIYEKYDSLFNCSGHGWANLQSVHLNLPFYDDEEFAALHTAIRLVLPLLPALAASSPVLEGKRTAHMDERLVYYQHNQGRFPMITGQVIPERVFSRRAYSKQIYTPIRQALAPFDKEEVLDPVWVNSRGAIARFDRGSIEIRILDIQETAGADLAILALVIEVLKLLVYEKVASFRQQQSWEVEPLHAMLQATVAQGAAAEITDADYLKFWGVQATSITAGALWQHLLAMVEKHQPEAIQHWKPTLKAMLQRGTLAEALVRVLGDNPSHELLADSYQELCDCLKTQRLFGVPVEA